MRPVHILPFVGALLIPLAMASRAQGDDDARPVSPIYGVSLPEGYRRWELIAPALEGEPLNELRAVVGNRTAIDAYRKGSLPFPDGTMLVKLAWKRAQSPDFNDPEDLSGPTHTLGGWKSGGAVICGWPCAAKGKIDLMV